MSNQNVYTTRAARLERRGDSLSGVRHASAAGLV
jgi:hypothetical protein